MNRGIMPGLRICNYSFAEWRANLENKEGNLADLYISEIRSHADTVHVNCLR